MGAHAADVAGLVARRRRWGVEPLPAAGGFEPLLEGELLLAQFLAHVRPLQVALPEGGGLLQGGPDSVKNAASARRSA